MVTCFASFDSYPHFSDYLDLCLRLKSFDQGKIVRRCRFIFGFRHLLFSVLLPRQFERGNDVWKYDRMNGEYESSSNLCMFHKCPMSLDGVVVHDPRGDHLLGDCWSIKEKELNLPSKEMLAMCYALEACSICIIDCRVHV